MWNVILVSHYGSRLLDGLQGLIPNHKWQLLSMAAETGKPYLVKERMLASRLHCRTVALEMGGPTFQLTFFVTYNLVYLELIVVSSVLPGANLKGSVIRCSRHGWLLMSSGSWGEQVFFFNPFTKQRIDLPDLDAYEFEGITFTSSPTSSDCIVFGYLISPRYVKLAFISRGKRRWTFSEVDRTAVHFDQSFSNPVYHQGLFYFMGKTGNLFTADPTRAYAKPATKLTNLPSKPSALLRSSHLLECNGKLLSVFIGRMGRFLQVYELNQGIMTWKEVESLEDTMLFLSSASSLSATSNGVGVSGLGNKVFLERFSGKNSVFYSLATKKLHTFWSGYNSNEWNDTKEYTNCAWIDPNFEKHDEEELQWSKKPKH